MDFQQMYIKDKRLLKKVAFSLKQIREKKGLTQSDVYNEINIHVARIELGERDVKLSTLSSLLAFYKIKISDFFKMIEG
ncbi:MAG: helix-turn-helix transcriptional regulator [Bacteroidetes bacterium]|nr:helix-turn-helix transcriptional regulator [Bacteroidota bacterium]